MKGKAVYLTGEQLRYLREEGLPTLASETEDDLFLAPVLTRGQRERAKERARIVRELVEKLERLEEAGS